MSTPLAFGRRHALFAAALVSAVALSFVAVRVGLTGSRMFMFLPWNLFLGWVPVALALGMVPLARIRAGWVGIGLLAVPWLLFLPNSIYLLTDLVHIRARAGVPHVYDGTMVGLFAAAGILAGLSAVSIAVEQLERIQRGLGALVLVPLFPLCGLGVWMGRYQRFNSWDVLHRPRALFWDVLEPALHLSPVLWITTATYAVVFAVAWGAFCSVRAPATR